MCEGFAGTVFNAHRAFLPEADLLATMEMLLIADHETTVNLITNGMLTLLRHPDVLDRLRRDPAFIRSILILILSRCALLSSLWKLALLVGYFVTSDKMYIR